MPKATIRKYIDTDQEKLVEIFRLNTPTYFAEEEEADLMYYLENEIEEYYVLEVEGMIVGSGGINFKEEKTQGYISWDLMHPDFQAKGLGRLLLNFRVEKLKSYANIQKIIVRTSQLVYKFYEKGGFTLTECVKDYWAEGFDLYKMEYKEA